MRISVKVRAPPGCPRCVPRPAGQVDPRLHRQGTCASTVLVDVGLPGTAPHGSAVPPVAETVTVELPEPGVPGSPPAASTSLSAHPRACIIPAVLRGRPRRHGSDSCQSSGPGGDHEGPCSRRKALEGRAEVDLQQIPAAIGRSVGWGADCTVADLRRRCCRTSDPAPLRVPMSHRRRAISISMPTPDRQPAPCQRLHTDGTRPAHAGQPRRRPSPPNPGMSTSEGSRVDVVNPDEIRRQDATLSRPASKPT